MVVAALGIGGCGMDVMIMGPETAKQGETVMFQIKVTNVSACPLDAGPFPDFAFVPLLPQEIVEDINQIFPICDLNNNIALSASLAEAGTVPRAAIQAQLESAAAGGPTATCSGPGLTCQPDGGLVICDIDGDFMPGEMRMYSCQAQALDPGRLFSLAGSFLEAEGVCKFPAMNAGAPCDEDADCGGAPDSCGSGICVDGMNDGNGCDVAMDCPLGTCTDCEENEGAGGDCTETLVREMAAPAPVVSPVGLLVISGALCAVAALKLRRSRRTPGA
jgi:hypothetical protein